MEKKRIFLFLLVIFWGLFFVSSITLAEDFFAQGINAFLNQDYQKAIDCFNQIIATDGEFLYDA